MNKTVSINIGGQVFQIDENAFDKLSSYLNSIRIRFSTTEGHDEIIADIESRIAEMFNDKLNDKKHVITLPDVEEVINIMGRPEEFENLDEEEEEQSTRSSQRKKRFFRNPDEKVLGGVCSGLSAYLGINDPLWLRLVFLLWFIFGAGTSLLIYVILWVIVPEAATPSEKLEMKGESINISNIEKSVKEEFDGIKSRINDVNTEGAISKSKTAFEKLAELIVDVVTFLIKFVFKIVALLLILLGLVLISAFIFALIFPIGLTGLTIPLIFGTKAMFVMGGVGLLLLLGIPALAIIYLGFRMLLNRKAEIKGLGLSFFGLWILGLILSVFVLGKIGTDFIVEERVKSKVQLEQPESETIFLEGDIVPVSEVPSDIGMFGWGEIYVIEDQLIIKDRIKLDVRKSANNKFELEQIINARGRNNRLAHDRANSVKYHISQEDSLILFPDQFSLSDREELRGQEIQLILRVPIGKSVYLGENIRSIIYDIKNVHNTYDGDMIGHTWIMLEEGLTCADCPGTEPISQKSSYKDYSQITSRGSFRIEIFEDSDYSVSISGDKKFMDNLNLDKVGERLIIETKRNLKDVFRQNNYGLVKVSTPTLSEIKFEGANHAYISGFKQKSLDVEVSGTSVAELDLDCKDLDIEVSGASTVELSGSGENLNVLVEGASEFNAIDYNVEVCDIRTEGASSAKVNVSDRMNAEASGASHITYKGLPMISSNVTGFSSIKPKK